MAVYDRVEKSRRRAVNAQKRYNKRLNNCQKFLPKSKFIILKIDSLISDIKLWWKLR